LGSAILGRTVENVVVNHFTICWWCICST